MHAKQARQLSQAFNDNSITQVILFEIEKAAKKGYFNIDTPLMSENNALSIKDILEKLNYKVEVHTDWWWDCGTYGYFLKISW